MDQEPRAGELEDQELAPPTHTLERRADERLRSGCHGFQRGELEHRGTRERRAGDGGVESLGERLDLGKLRHGLSSRRRPAG